RSQLGARRDTPRASACSPHLEGRHAPPAGRPRLSLCTRPFYPECGTQHAASGASSLPPVEPFSSLPTPSTADSRFVSQLPVPSRRPCALVAMVAMAGRLTRFGGARARRRFPLLNLLAFFSKTPPVLASSPLSVINLPMYCSRCVF